MQKPDEVYTTLVCVVKKNLIQDPDFWVRLGGFLGAAKEEKQAVRLKFLQSLNRADYDRVGNFLNALNEAH